IKQALPGFSKYRIKLSSPQANHVARSIAKSVTKDGRFQSYLAMGGPAWLHSRIEQERSI
ncbi:hypothetical protein ISN45_Aa07g027620, partial [Arabidopsis thaliana x Arabidopsis arenosa]